MTASVVRFDVREGIGWITLNRPEVLNAMHPPMLRALADALDEARENRDVEALIVAGAGNVAFSAGADIRFLNSAAPLEVRDFARLAVAVNEKVETLGKVVVAAIGGYALGGGLELAEACMLRVAASHARLGHPEVRIGAIAGFGGTTRLPRLIGKGRAAELLLTGAVIGAKEAQQIGLVNRVVAPNRLLMEAERLVRDILCQAPSSVKLTWEAMHRGLNLSSADSALLGADYFGLLATTAEFRAGTRHFLEKKEPRFRKARAQAASGAS